MLKLLSKNNLDTVLKNRFVNESVFLVLFHRFKIIIRNSVCKIIIGINTKFVGFGFNCEYKSIQVSCFILIRIYAIGFLTPN